MGRMSLLYKINRIHNWNLERTSSWINVFRKRIPPMILFVRKDKQKVKDILSSVLRMTHEAHPKQSL